MLSLGITGLSFTGHQIRFGLLRLSFVVFHVQLIDVAPRSLAEATGIAGHFAVFEVVSARRATLVGGHPSGASTVAGGGRDDVALPRRPRLPDELVFQSRGLITAGSA